MFFGRERNLNIRVVIKQYKGTNKEAIMSEIKIFTRLANLEKEKSGNDIVEVIH